MRKVKNGLIAMALVVGLVANAGAVAAESTSGGSLGKTTVSCSIGTYGGSSSYCQARLKITTANKVEKLGIKNINVVKKDGGGVTGASVSAKNAYSAEYAGAAYAPSSIKSISGHYYVTSSNFGSFSKNLSY